jgi:phage-related minor tail protein
LQSGRFQGDELRAILEGMPVVTQALADELGVTVGALRKLGAEGKITGDVFVRAMRSAKESIDEAFGRTSPTIGQAVTNLKTTFALLLDEVEKNTNFGKGFAGSIEFIAFQVYKLSKNVDAIIGPITTVIKVLGALAAATIVGKAFSILAGIFTASVRAVTLLSTSFSNAKDIMLNFGKIMSIAGGGGGVFAQIVKMVLKTFAQFVGL